MRPRSIKLRTLSSRWCQLLWLWFNSTRMFCCWFALPFGTLNRGYICLFWIYFLNKYLRILILFNLIFPSSFWFWFLYFKWLFNTFVPLLLRFIGFNISFRCFRFVICGEASISDRGCIVCTNCTIGIISLIIYLVLSIFYLMTYLIQWII